MADKTTTRNRHEEEILGYKNVLELIHDNYEIIFARANYILQLHGELLKFTPLEPYETPEAVEQLCNEFNVALKEEIVDPLILIPIFILDFLCIHPFNDGNSRMSRLMTLLLLYRSGYKVGQYISIEKAIADKKIAIMMHWQYLIKGGMITKMIIKLSLSICLELYFRVIVNLRVELQ